MLPVFDAAVYLQSHTVGCMRCFFALLDIERASLWQFSHIKQFAACGVPAGWVINGFIRNGLNMKTLGLE